MLGKTENQSTPEGGKNRRGRGYVEIVRLERSTCEKRAKRIIRPKDLEWTRRKWIAGLSKDLHENQPHREQDGGRKKCQRTMPEGWLTEEKRRTS